MWACDLPNSSNSSGSHNHSPQLLASEPTGHLASCRPRALEQFHLVAAGEKVAELEGLRTCPEQQKHKSWMSFSGAKLTVGESLVKSQ